MKNQKLSVEYFWLFVGWSFCLVSHVLLLAKAPRRLRPSEQKKIQLPEPNMSGTVSLEMAIRARRSTRQFADKQLNYAQIGQLAWAGQGITDKQHGLRAAPSAELCILLNFICYAGRHIHLCSRKSFT